MSSATGPSSPALPPAAKVVKAKNTAVTKKASKAPSSHPSWKQIITECIAANPEDARQGVSRSTIKKYAEQKFNINTSSGNLYQLNRAITNGVEKGTFVLPKGPSGKIKLSPKSKSAATKENSKPLSKKAGATTTKKPVVKPAATTKKAITKPVTKKAATKAATTKKTSSAKTDVKKVAVKKAATKLKAKASVSKSKKVAA